MLFKRVGLLVLLPNARADLGKALLNPHSTFFMKSFSAKTCTADEQSFTVSYLISSCGLSPETALRVSKKVHFHSSIKPDSVLKHLRNHGFNDSHISKLARVRPELLLSDPEKTLSPKLEFFQSIDIPTADLANILSSSPTLFCYSLKNQLIPVYNYLRSVILLDDKQVRKTLKNAPRLFTMNLENKVIPRIAVLEEFGVTASSLSFLATHCPSMLFAESKRFHITMKQVVEMGLDPSKQIFVRVLQMMLRTSKSTWEHKVEVFRKCGWSDDDFQVALKKWPLTMGLSEKKIMRAMDLLVNKMGWKPTDVARTPSVLAYNLKKRTIPRCSVIKVLILKGLIHKDVSFCTVITKKDMHFLDKFVTKYQEDVPQLFDIFNGKAELNFESGEISERKLT